MEAYKLPDKIFSWHFSKFEPQYSYKLNSYEKSVYANGLTTS